MLPGATPTRRQDGPGCDGSRRGDIGGLQAHHRVRAAREASRREVARFGGGRGRRHRPSNGRSVTVWTAGGQLPAGPHVPANGVDRQGAQDAQVLLLWLALEHLGHGSHRADMNPLTATSRPRTFQRPSRSRDMPGTPPALLRVCGRDERTAGLRCHPADRRHALDVPVAARRVAGSMRPANECGTARPAGGPWPAPSSMPRPITVGIVVNSTDPLGAPRGPECLPTPRGLRHEWESLKSYPWTRASENRQNLNQPRPAVGPLR